MSLPDSVDLAEEARLEHLANCPACLREWDTRGPTGAECGGCGVEGQSGELGTVRCSYCNMERSRDYPGWLELYDDDLRCCANCMEENE